MKKIVAMIALMIAGQNTFAQSTKDIFEEFGKEYKAESVSISPFLMTIGRMFMDDDTPKAVKQVRSMKVLDLEECPQAVKERFAQRIKDLDTEGYETLMQVNDEGEKVRILMKTDKQAVKELLFLCTGNDDCALIQLKGNIRKTDIAELMNEHTTDQ